MQRLCHCAKANGKCIRHGECGGFADFNAKANGKSFSLFSLLSLSLSLNDGDLKRSGKSKTKMTYLKEWSIFKMRADGHF
jgi:hypothetical protein